jgi:hypothetical protein
MSKTLCFFSLLLLLLCSSCVSRTVRSQSDMPGETTKEIVEKKIIWIWDPEFRE